MGRPRTDPLSRFEKLYITEPNSGCWIWMGAIHSQGYGLFRFDPTKRSMFAHRIAYQLFVSDIPKPLQIDHLCRNRFCVNPKHMELVTLVENVLRGESPPAQKARQTHCQSGHRLGGDNAYRSQSHGRRCRECYNSWRRNRKQLRRENAAMSVTA